MGCDHCQKTNNYVLTACVSVQELTSGTGDNIGDDHNHDDYNVGGGLKLSTDC